MDQVGQGDDGLATPDTFVGDIFAWLNAVRSDHELPALAFVVAYSIGQHFNRKTREAWPGHKRIAELVGRDERSVRPVIKALVDRGHLVVAKSWGDGHSTRYRMPGANRKETSGSLGSGDSSNRTKTSGSRRAKGRANRTKPSGSDGLGDGSNRKFSSEQTGRFLPVNQSTESTSCSSAPQPRRAGEQADEVECRQGAEHVSGVASVASVNRRRSLDAAWAAIVGPDLAGKLGLTDALHRALEAGKATTEDVEAGMRDWQRIGTAQPPAWSFFVRWAETAAERRKGGRLVHPAERDELAAFAPPKAGTLRLNGFTQTLAAVEGHLQNFVETNHWDEQYFGFQPDTGLSDIPADVLARHLPMVDLKDGCRVPLCAVQRQIEDYRRTRGRDWRHTFGDPPGEPECLLSDDLQAEALRSREPIITVPNIL